MRYVFILTLMLTMLTAPLVQAAVPAPPSNSLLPPSYIYVRYHKPEPGAPHTIIEVVAVVLGDEGAEIRFVGDLNIYSENGKLVHGECLNSKLSRNGETVIARYVVPPEHSGSWLRVEVLGAFRASRCVYRVGYESTVWAAPSVNAGGVLLTFI